MVDLAFIGQVWIYCACPVCHCSPSTREWVDGILPPQNRLAVVWFDHWWSVLSMNQCSSVDQHEGQISHAPWLLGNPFVSCLWVLRGRSALRGFTVVVIFSLYPVSRILPLWVHNQKMQSSGFGTQVFLLTLPSVAAVFIPLHGFFWISQSKRAGHFVSSSGAGHWQLWYVCMYKVVQLAEHWSRFTSLLSPALSLIPNINRDKLFPCPYIY